MLMLTPDVVCGSCFAADWEGSSSLTDTGRSRMPSGCSFLPSWPATVELPPVEHLIRVDAMLPSHHRYR